MPATGHPIRSVARLTGLSVDTLRAWERRYQAVVPDRGDRGRLYSDRHIARLKQLAALVEAGHAIGTIAGLNDAALRKLREAGPDAESAAAGPSLDLAPLRRSIAAYDIDAIESALTKYAVLLPPRELIFSVILPLLRDVGSRWESGAICPAHEHLVSGAVRNVLGSLRRAMPRPANATRILFAAPSGERHELGLLSAAVLAGWAGYDTGYLGPDLPAADLAHAARATKPAIAVVAGVADAVANLDDVRALKRLPEQVELWAGGPQAASWRELLGKRARVVNTLEEFAALLDRDAS